MMQTLLVYIIYYIYLFEGALWVNKLQVNKYEFA